MIYFVGKTVKSFKTLLLSFRHGMQLKKQFGLNPWLCLSCLNDSTQTAIEIFVILVRNIYFCVFVNLRANGLNISVVVF